MAYFLLTSKDMIVYVLWQKSVGEGYFYPFKYMCILGAEFV